MRQVWKFPIESHSVTLFMPEGAEIIAFQKQFEAPCIWALVKPKAQLVERSFRLIGTGSEVGRDMNYIGTIQEAGGHLVWHLFEVAA